jgi:hypothetical protein
MISCTHCGKLFEPEMANHDGVSLVACTHCKSIHSAWKPNNPNPADRSKWPHGFRRGRGEPFATEELEAGHEGRLQKIAFKSGRIAFIPADEPGRPDYVIRLMAREEGLTLDQLRKTHLGRAEATLKNYLDKPKYFGFTKETIRDTHYLRGPNGEKIAPLEEIESIITALGPNLTARKILVVDFDTKSPFETHDTLPTTELASKQIEPSKSISIKDNEPPTLSDPFRNAIANEIPSKYRAEAEREIARIVERFKRNQTLVAELKEKYKHKCQLCQTDLSTPLSQEKSSDVHHIKPLSQNGEDSIGNMIVVCPNHHRQLHLCNIRLNLNELFVIDGHNINEENIKWHNSTITRLGQW